MALVFLLGVGCGPAAPEELGQTEQALFGELSYKDCDGGTVDMEARIKDAVDWLRTRVVTDAYRQCLKDGLSIDHDWRMVEEIAELSKTSLPVKFTCKEGLGARASTSSSGIAAGDPENMTIDADYVRDNTKELVGSTILHEIMHNHHFMHWHNVGHSVSNVTQACVRDYRPYGFTRSTLVGEVSLAHAGGSSTGHEAELRCPDRQLASGLFVARDVSTLTSFGVECSEPGTPGDTLGEYTPKGSIPVWRNCKSGEVLVGFEGYADDRISGLWPLCASLAALKGDAAYTNYRRGTLLGQAAGWTFKRVCPNRRAVVGFRRVLTSGSLDRVKLICGEPTALDRRKITDSSPVGGTGGHQVIRQCEGSGVMTGLFSSRDPEDRMRTLGGYCAPFTGGAVHVLSYDNETDNRTEVIGTVIHKMDPLTFCDAGMVMVGVEGQASASIVYSAAPRCMDYRDWQLGLGSPTVPSSATYSTKGTHFSLDCKAGEVVVGLGGREGALVDRIWLRCAEPVGGLPARVVSPVGGPGGVEMRSRCQGGMPMTGINGVVDSNLRYLAARCGRSAGEKVFRQDDYETLLPHENHLWVGESSCPGDHVMVGLELGLRADSKMVERAAPICLTLPQVKARITPPSTGAGSLGPYSIGQLLDRVTCDPGEVALGLHGNHGALVDSVGLFCGPPQLVPGDIVQDHLLGIKQEALHRISLPVGNTAGLAVKLFASSGVDFDLYLRRGVVPTPGSPDTWSDTGSASTKTVSVTGAAGEDVYYVLVRSVSSHGTYKLQIGTSF